MDSGVQAMNYSDAPRVLLVDAGVEGDLEIHIPYMRLGVISYPCVEYDNLGLFKGAQLRDDLETGVLISKLCNTIKDAGRSVDMRNLEHLIAKQNLRLIKYSQLQQKKGFI